MNESVNEEPQFLEKLFMSPQLWSCLFWFPRQSSSASLSFSSLSPLFITRVSARTSGPGARRSNYGRWVIASPPAHTGTFCSLLSGPAEATEWCVVLQTLEHSPYSLIVRESYVFSVFNNLNKGNITLGGVIS